MTSDMYSMGYKCFDLTHSFNRCGCPKSMIVTFPTRVATKTFWKLFFVAQPIAGCLTFQSSFFISYCITRTSSYGMALAPFICTTTCSSFGWFWLVWAGNVMIRWTSTRDVKMLLTNLNFVQFSCSSWFTFKKIDFRTVTNKIRYNLPLHGRQGPPQSMPRSPWFCFPSKQVSEKEDQFLI